MERAGGHPRATPWSFGPTDRNPVRARQGSWLKLVEAIDLVRTIQPSRTFPIHEAELSERGLASVSVWYGRVTNHGYRYLAPGEQA